MNLNHLIIPITIAVILILILVLIACGYVKAPPDQAYIISGLKHDAKILIGRSGIRIPFFERMDRLYLGQMTVDIKTEQSVPTNDFINVNVDAVAKVRITPSQEGIRLAAKNFLNKKPEDITMDLQDSLQGNMREIIGTLSLKEINTDRDSFSDQVMLKASKDMDKLGIEILSCNIQNVTDDNGLIRDLGADNTSKIKKDAAIAKAQADRDIAIAQAEANKSANDARVLAETEIAEKNNELEIRKSELQKHSDTKKAEADAAYEIQKQEQQKTIQAATVNAQIAKAEREAELRRQEVAVQQQALEAEINKKADADRYAIEQAAAADLTRRQREAEAKKYEQEKEAEARKAQAEAQKADALEQARRQGQQEAKAEAERAEAQRAAEYQKKAAGLDAEYQKRMDELEPQFVDTITGIYEHIFDVDLHSYREVLCYLISATMRKTEDNRSFLVHVSKEDYPYVSMQKKQIMAGATAPNSTVEIVEDMTLGKGECMIETESGIFDCGLGTQLSELRQKLKLLSYEG